MPTSLLALGAVLSCIVLVLVVIVMGTPALYDAIIDAFKEKG